MLFLKEGDSLYIERLEATVTALEASMVNGVADAYFFNFTKKIGSQLKDVEYDEEQKIKLFWEEKVQGGPPKMHDAKAVTCKFHVFVPLSF